MPATFSQQLRYLRRNEPSLYESISKAYRKCLMESNLAPQMAQTDNEVAETPMETTDITQSKTKGVDDLMAKVHAMVGVNANKKEGEEIFDNKDDNVETAQPDPAQVADLFGQTPPAENVEPAQQEVPPPMEQPVEPPAEQPAGDNGDFDLGNMFSDETQPSTPPEAPPEQPVEEPVEEPSSTEETPTDQPASNEEDPFGLGNLF